MQHRLPPRSRMRGWPAQTGPAWRSDMMTLGKIFGILIFSSLVATGATLAGGISKNLATSKNLASAKQVANVKADKEPLKGAAASVVVHHVWPEAPIVVGRSVSLHHKTKLHHVKVKPLDSNENLTSADGSQLIQLEMK